MPGGLYEYAGGLCPVKGTVQLPGMNAGKITWREGFGGNMAAGIKGWCILFSGWQVCQEVYFLGGEVEPTRTAHYCNRF